MEHLCLKRPCRLSNIFRPHRISISSFNLSFELAIKDRRHSGKKTQDFSIGSLNLLQFSLLTCSVRCKWCDRVNLVHATDVLL